MSSDRMRELIGRGAAVAAHSPKEWLREIEDAPLSAEYLQALADDPDLTAQIRRTNRANVLHWATWNVRSPGAPVPANVGPEALATARELVRRGLNDSALQSYRSGQNAAWLRWKSIAFELTSDPTELRELLDVSTRSNSAFVDATIAAVSAQIQAERDELTREAGYIKRGIDHLPRQGTKEPWLMSMDYQADVKLLREDSVEDECLRFSSPTAAARTAHGLPATAHLGP